MPLVRVSSLAMGALAVEDLDVGLSDAFPRVPGADGVLGADVLEDFRLIVDRASRQLTLEVIHSTASPRGARISLHHKQNGVYLSHDGRSLFSGRVN